MFVHPERQTFISMHVDDLLILTPDIRFKADLLRKLRTEFTISDLGIVQKYLGVNISWLPDGSCKITQQSYINQMAAEYGLSDLFSG